MRKELRPGKCCFAPALCGLFCGRSWQKPGRSIPASGTPTRLMMRERRLKPGQQRMSHWISFSLFVQVLFRCGDVAREAERVGFILVANFHLVAVDLQEVISQLVSDKAPFDTPCRLKAASRMTLFRVVFDSPLFLSCACQPRLLVSDLVPLETLRSLKNGKQLQRRR